MEEIWTKPTSESRVRFPLPPPIWQGKRGKRFREEIGHLEEAEDDF
jgi:hypothetical protein